MKSNSTLSVMIIALQLCNPLIGNSATTILVGANDNGSIGSSNYLTGVNALAVGYNNQVLMARSQAIGSSNIIEAPDSLVIGRYNYGGQYDNEHSIFISGVYNSSMGYASITSGSYNITDWGAGGSITGGYANLNGAPGSLMVGTGNTASSPYHANAIIAGKYNQSLTKAALFVIGNGTGSQPESRKNAIVVYQDGDVIITKPQGDISMGIYE